MPAHAEILHRLLNPGVIAVVRVDHPSKALPTAEALLAGGVIAIELTMTIPNALEAIREAAGRLGGDALIGVGTVLDARVASAAIEAGAQFVVSPITRADVISTARAAGKPVMAGAYTPTEAQTAHDLGADFIKLFPADGLGPAYVKALKAPLPHLRIIPTGGVDLTTLPAFLQAGCAAVGVGSAMVSPKAVNAGDWKELTRLAAEFVKVARDCRAR